MNELGILRTCRPGKGTVPTKNRDPERHTTQHAGKVEARGTGGGEGACGDAKRRASRPTGAGMRREMNFQGVEAHCGTSGTGSAGLGSGYGLLRGGATPRPQTKHGRPPSRFPASGMSPSTSTCCKCSSCGDRDKLWPSRSGGSARTSTCGAAKGGRAAVRPWARRGPLEKPGGQYQGALGETQAYEDQGSARMATAWRPQRPREHTAQANGGHRHWS